MKALIVLFAVIVLARAQINQTCVSNDNCNNGTFPCLSTNCICDPNTLTCKLDIHQPCIPSQGYCNSNTTCSFGQCLAFEGKPCFNDTDCLVNGVCFRGVCRANVSFAWDVINNVYSPCASECATCIMPNSNTSCLNCTNPNKVAIDGICVCPPGTASRGNLCLPCDTTCLTCAVPLSIYGCSSCALPNMTLISGVCFCPSGMAWNNVTRTCQECDPSCATCSVPGNPAFCTSCDSGTLVGGRCTLLCPNPHTASNGVTCEYCDPTCLTCLVPGDPNRCTSCCTGRKLVGGMCVPTKNKCSTDTKYKNHCPTCRPNMCLIGDVCKCKEGLVGDSTSPFVSDTFCLSCYPTCRTCYEADNPEACTSCHKGMVLVNGTCIVPDLPRPPFQNCTPECATCVVRSSQTQCLTCSLEDALQLNGICYCPPNTYSTGTACVSPCDAPCTECFINSSSICTSCPPGLTPVDGSCVCPNDSALTDSGVCAPCDPSCLSCARAGDPLACTICRDPRAVVANGRCACPDLNMIINATGLCHCGPIYIEVGSLCIVAAPPTGCPPGTFFNGDTCANCSANCIVCLNETVCTVCEPKYFADKVTGTCQPCSPACLTCTNTSTLCTACPPGFILTPEGDCNPACPACCSNCTFHMDHTPVCTTCLPGLVFANGQCTTCALGIPGCARCRNCQCTKCLAGYYLANSTTCASCASAIPNCELCNGPKTCLRCAAPLTFDRYIRRCVYTLPPPVTSCPEGSYATASGICLPCHHTCRACIGPGPGMCTRCRDGLEFFREYGFNWGSCGCKSGYSYDERLRRCNLCSTTARPKT